MAHKKSEEKGEEKKVKRLKYKNSHYPRHLYKKDSELEIQTNHHQTTNEAEKN